MHDHDRKWEFRKARLEVWKRLRSYFAVLRLYAQPQAEEDRRRFPPAKKWRPDS